MTTQGLWTIAKEAELVRLWLSGMSIREIGKELKMSLGAVMRKRKGLKLPDRGSPVMDIGSVPYVERSKPDFSFPDFKDYKEPEDD